MTDGEKFVLIAQQLVYAAVEDGVWCVRIGGSPEQPFWLPCKSQTGALMVAAAIRQTIVEGINLSARPNHDVAGQ